MRPQHHIHFKGQTVIRIAMVGLGKMGLSHVAIVRAHPGVQLVAACDTMTYLTGLLPVVQGVAVFAALTREADSRRAAGDERSRGQIMADTLVERVTGLSTAAEVSVEVQLVVTDRALLSGDNEPALLSGYGVVPAQWARDQVAASACTATTWIRRVFTAPSTGELIAMDSQRRRAPAAEWPCWIRIKMGGLTSISLKVANGPPRLAYRRTGIVCSEISRGNDSKR